MSNASMEDITKFLACKRVALVGVSRRNQHFSRSQLNEFIAKGYDAVPVNPNASEIAGRKCFGHVSEINPPVEAALLLTGTPETTDRALTECTETHVRNIWVYKTTKSNANYTHAAEACRADGAALIEDKCPLMFLPQTGFIHRFHGFLSKVAGTYPS